MKKCTFLIISHWTVSERSCRENQNIFYNLFFENHAVYEIMWKNMIEIDRPQMIIEFDACALYARWLRLQYRHTLWICNYFAFQGNRCYANAWQCYVIRTLPVLLRYRLTTFISLATLLMVYVVHHRRCCIMQFFDSGVICKTSLIFFLFIINANLQSTPPGAISKCAKGA